MPTASARNDEPGVLDAADVLIRHILKIIRGVRIGQVISYDPVQRTANVQPVRRRRARGAVFDEPIVAQAPVGWWRFGRMVIFGELEVGDEVLLLTCERELRPWFIGGAPHDPSSPRMHDPTDTVVLPLISSVVRPITAAAARTFYIGREDGTAGISIPMDVPARIEVDAGPAGIVLGSAAVEPAIPATTFLTAMASAFSAAATSVVAMDGGASLIGDLAARFDAAAGALRTAPGVPAATPPATPATVVTTTKVLVE